MKRILTLSTALAALFTSSSVYAQRPAQPASNLYVSAAIGTSMVLQFTPGDGHGRTLSMARVSSASAPQVALQPRDSVAYPVAVDYGLGPKASAGWVVASTPLDIVVVAGLTASSWYQLQVTEYGNSEDQPLFAPAGKSLRVLLHSSSTTVITTQAPTLGAAAPLAAVSLNAWPNPVKPGEEVQVVGPETTGLTAVWISASGQQLPAAPRHQAAGVAIATPARPGLYLLRLLDRQGQLVATARLHVQH